MDGLCRKLCNRGVKGMPATAERTKRKRLPLIREICPIHEVAMTVEKVRRGCREWQCSYPGCKHRKKTLLN